MAVKSAYMARKSPKLERSDRQPEKGGLSAE